jgi:hypothetical protein
VGFKKSARAWIGPNCSFLPYKEGVVLPLQSPVRPDKSSESNETDGHLQAPEHISMRTGGRGQRCQVLPKHHPHSECTERKLKA